MFYQVLVVGINVLPANSEQCWTVLTRLDQMNSHVVQAVHMLRLGRLEARQYLRGLQSGWWSYCTQVVHLRWSGFHWWL